MLLDLYQMEREIQLHQERFGRGHYPIRYQLAGSGLDWFRNQLGSAMIRLGEFVQGHASRPIIQPGSPIQFDAPVPGRLGSALPHKG